MSAATKLPTLQDRVLGDFILGELLDEGGFGTVYRAEQRGLGRPAVVKVIRRSLTTRRETVERFALEAKLASRFDHPYAAHIYAFGVEADGLMWIAMELVKGTPLHELLRRSGPLPRERFVPLFERLCEVVQSAHDQGIVHRDIKPSNVMVIARAGRLMPKLLDFGIAKLITAPVTAPAEVLELPRAKSATKPGTLELEHTVDAASTGAGSVGASGSLTQEGQVLGSPVYMAPEQWLDATTTGPGADQYALALLAYEALTGTRAYTAGTIEGLAYQHMHVELRELPPEFPPALHDVLVRATAKSPERRFASLTELASAVRSALGVEISELDEPLPALPVDLRAEWISDAPRPLAESIAALASARTPIRADERVTSIAALLARWLGILALACRSKLGRIDEASLDSDLVRALRRRALLDGEWLDLALASSRRHGDEPVWPIPEMAAYLASEDSVAALRDLLRSSSGAAIDETVTRRALESRVAQLAAVLDALAWLLDYTIAREVEGGLELWMGQRSDDRPMQRVASDESGAMVLLDGYGARIARISPLLEVATPMPGEVDELFVFTGPGRNDATARFVSYPRGFERENDQLWSWLGTHVLESQPEAEDRSADRAPPYPGLAAYTASDHESFVGRERDVEELLNRLRTQTLVTVVGPSGIGKTSFLAAGVVPALGAGYHTEIIRPGNAPLATLAAIAGRVDAPPYREGVSAPAATASGIATALAKFAYNAGTHLALIVDQAEELFTMCSDEVARTAFAEALVLAAAHPRIHVVITMRDDFLCRADQLAPWRGRIGASVQVLRVPGRTDLERMIVVPARRCGYDFDDPRLPAEIAGEVADRPGALPLVAFTAAKLWELRDRHFRRLTRATYDQIGGVTGALVRHADGVVDRMPAPDRRLVRIAFRRLLSAEGTRALTGRKELESALGGTPAATAVLDRLLAARLLVSRDDDDGDRIEIIHETLATTWPRLAAWRREDADGARLQEQLAVAARHWNDRGRPADLLWRGAALAELVRWRATDAAPTELEDAFVRASVATASRARRRRLGAIGGAFAVLTAGVVGLVAANREIGDQRTAAVDRLAASFEERGRLALGEGDASRAMLYLAEAARLGARGPGFDMLAARAARPLDAGLAIIGHGKAGVENLSVGERVSVVDVDHTLTSWDRAGTPTHLADGIRVAAVVGDMTVAVAVDGSVSAFGGDGRLRWDARRPAPRPALASVVASATDGIAVVGYGPTAQVWELASGRLRGEGALGAPAIVLALAPNGATPRFAVGDAAGTVTIWNAAPVTKIATCPARKGMIRNVVFTPDGLQVVSAGADGEVRVCDAESGAEVHRLIGHGNQVLGVDVSPDGQQIASVGRDGKARLWDAHSGILQATLEGHRGSIWSVQFSPDGTRLLTVGSDDGAVRLWNRQGLELGSLQGSGGRLVAGFWDRDGRHVITGATDGAIRRWDPDRAVDFYPAQAHTAPIGDISVTRDDRWAVTGGDDGLAVVWDLHAHRPVTSMHHPAAVDQVAVADDGASVLTSDVDGTPRLWSIPEGKLLATIPAKDVSAIAYVGGVAITASDTSIEFFSATGAPLGKLPLDYHPNSLNVDPSGRWLAVDGLTHSLVMIDLASRTVATRLATHEQVVNVAVDTRHVAITDGRLIRMWDVGTWMPRGELAGHHTTVGDLRFLGDGRLVSMSDDTAFVWGPDGNMLGRFADGERAFALASPSDEGYIATSCGDGSVRIWDPVTYHRLLVAPSHRLPVFHLAVSHDGGLALSAGRDGRLVMWDVRHQHRSAAELADIVRCRVPFRLEGDTAMPREVDFDDPACRALSHP